MRKSRSYSVAIAVWVLAGFVVVLINPETLLAQAPTSTSARATSFTFTEIKFPGAIRTRAVGLNDHGEIVGNYFDSNGVFHGYLLKQGNFITFDPPNSIHTEANAINNAGVIAGNFTDSNNLVHGYLLYRGVFTIFDFPGAGGTFASDMNDLLQVVGTYVDPGSNAGIDVAAPGEHGFLLSNGTFTSIDFPGGVADTEAIGINNLGEIVGALIDASGNTHGYLLSKGVFTTFDFPGAFSLTQPQGINSHNEIVGFYDDSDGQLHGFRLKAGIFSTVDVPNAFDTEAARVNDAGQIVGIYHLSGVHAFFAAPSLMRKP